MVHRVADHSWIIVAFLLYIRIICSVCMYIAGLISLTTMSLGIQVYETMKETVNYLAGFAGPSGYGSNTTAEQVLAQKYTSCSRPRPHLTAIITGM